MHYAYSVPPKPVPLLGGPLKPQHLLVLLALARGPVHGYEIKKEIERTGGLRLDPGSLYRLIARLVDEGLIVNAAHADSESADPRRRHYELTRLGRETLRAETERLAQFVDTVRAIGTVYPAGKS
jgi:DNA-binding PadR family transcriptional regulator